MKKGAFFSNRKLLALLASVVLLWLSVYFSTPARANPVAIKKEDIWLYKRSGFFRFSYDNVSMPNNIEDMGLLGIGYYADLMPYLYAGVGGFGSVAGSQGGLFVLGFAAGLHAQFAPHWWGEMGLFVGGGGGRSSLVGGGLMIRPNVGIVYDFNWSRLGLHYSYINFPSGLIHSKQIGLDFDLPLDFYYVPYSDALNQALHFARVQLSDGKFIYFQRNDFAIIMQAYFQKPGTKNVNGSVQDGTIGIVGAELDHYINPNVFWSVKAGGAYTGIPNGYMDVLGGIGYHQPLAKGIAIVPQFLAGAGGGGNVDTGGGILMMPQLGLEVPLTSAFAARLSGGYLWAPKGELKAATLTAVLMYHLNVASGDRCETLTNFRFWPQGWRIHFFNQTYLRPQRTYTTATPAINMVALQIDQLITPLFFFSYQAASAYSGDHAGGYATGMIGPGIQSPSFFNQHAQVFAEVLLGAGGGGSLALGGGALIEPVLGFHYALTEGIGLTTSVSQLKALRHDLNTTVINAGLTIRFGTLNQLK